MTRFRSAMCGAKPAVPRRPDEPAWAICLLLCIPWAGLGQVQRPKGANDWMLAPTPTSAATGVSAELRHRRDLYYDAAARHIGIKQPLTSALAAQFPGFGEGSRLSSTPDIRPVPLRAIVTAKFGSARSILSASRLAVYTEVQFHVTDVFEDVSGHISPGTDITSAFLGGTVSTGDGQVISLMTSRPRRYFVQPGRTYLLVLQYKPTPEVYAIAGDWDFTSGVVRANSSFDREREIHGGSEILGLDKEGLANYLNQRHIK